MPRWPPMVDENRVRLRASCNACNESKVRCSQQKPTCTRCERNESECIYGLSRRTHKDAPPISIPSSQRGRGPSRPGRPPRLPSSGDTRSSTSTSLGSKGLSKSATRSNSAMREEPAEPAEPYNHDDANLLDDFMSTRATETDSMYGVTLLDLSNLVTGSTGNTSLAPGYFSSTGAEYTNSTPWHGDSRFSASRRGDALGMGIYQALDGGGGCTCHAGVTELLATMRGGGGSNDQRLSLDAQLAKLNQCIVSSETSMGCVHGREDSEPIHIMAIAMLIGYVIDGFEMLASESPLRRSTSLSSPAPAAEMATLGNAERGSRSGIATPSSISMSLGGPMEPKLSWGVLELVEDDETDLRQWLYLLSFRKLEKVLSRLKLHIRDLHIASARIPDPSRYLAFVSACDSTLLWLEKKAGGVKRLIAVSPRDEMMDSAFP